jgi:RNA polymerase sigma-70 factor (family 1)
MSESFPDPIIPENLLRKETVDNSQGGEDLFLRKIFSSDPKHGMEILFRTYYTPLCSHAVRFVYSKQIAEDLVSEVFFQFYRTESFKQVRSSYASYLFRAVRNESFTYLKKEFSKRAFFSSNREDDYVTDRQQPDMEVHFNHLLLKVTETVAQLSPQCQKVFLLSRFENKKYNEIADELEISPKTVEIHISKALRFLRNNLRGEWLSVIFLLLP